MLGLFIQRVISVAKYIKIALFVGSCRDAREAKSSGVHTSEVFYCIMKHLDKVLYRNCIKDASALKALAMFVYVKQHKPCSVFPDYSVERLSLFCGLSKNTTRKRMKILEGMGLVERVGRRGQHMLFKKARRRHANIDVGKVHFDSIGEVELALRALFIREIQRSKDWLEQRVFEAYNPKSKASYMSMKRSLRICRKRGVTEFTDNGISWKTISRKLDCSLSMVSNVLKFGEDRGFFKIHRYIIELENERREITSYSDERNVFISKSGRIFKYHCNTFSVA